MWTKMYTARSYRDLPWFDAKPSAELVGAVEGRFFPPGASVLDIGCGAGTSLLYLARQGLEAHGVDLSPEAIAAARARAQEEGVSVDARVGDALALPYPAHSFDGANDRGCFHTLPFARRRAYAAEVARVLRPEGRMLLMWISREETGAEGPPHRPSLGEVADALEPWFIFDQVRFGTPGSGRPGGGGRWGSYVARLVRRTGPFPPRR
jgi:SAM-dependent methyltransferase